jgi:transcriptional regulator
MSRLTDRSVYGMVDLLVLKTLSRGGELHGLSIIDEIRKTSGEFLHIEDGALYPALHRLQKEGLLLAEWRISEKRRRAKFYTITADGRRELKQAVTAWRQHTTAVGRVLEIEWGEV